jgi:hypothetical protein
VLKVAVPEPRVPVPRVVVPSLKVTVPVAVEGATVAVNVTACPNVDGLAEEVTAVVVLVGPEAKLIVTDGLPVVAGPMDTLVAIISAKLEPPPPPPPFPA